MSAQSEKTLAFAIDRLPPGTGPGFRRLAEALKVELLDRGPASGTRLPSVRGLAGRLGLHSSTVRAAYNALEAEGWVSSHVGRGSFVDRLPREGFRFRFPPAVEQVHSLAGLHAELDRVPVDSIDLFSLAPEVGAEALVAFRRCLAAVVEDEGRGLLSYGGPSGLRGLREEVARRLSLGGRTLDPDEVIITSGAQQALELVVRCLVGPGEAVVAGCPTYLNLVGTVAAQGARLISIPTGPDGLDLKALERAAREPGVRLLYVMPTFQNPTGLSLGRSTRQAFLDVAKDAQLPILEDDLEGYLRYEGESLPSLHAMDREGRVMLAGSVSKSLFPGLRIGWIVAPSESRERLIALKRFSDLETARLPQAAMARFMAEPGGDGFLRAQNETLRRRRDRLLDSLSRLLPQGCRWTSPQGGPALWLELPRELDGREVAAAARRQGLLVAPGDLFYPDRRRTCALRLSFARAPIERIEEGVGILAELVRERMVALPGEGRSTPVL